MTVRRVEFDRLGGPQALRVVEAAEPHAGAGEVRVRVQYAGLNPLDAKIFSGAPTARPYTVAFPSGNGIDFSGIVDEVGPDVAGFAPGDAVLGARQFVAQADFVVAEPADLVHRPGQLAADVAGALSIVGRTAWASVHSLGLTARDTVLVSAAAGGVGVLAAQLARRTGARVIGTAGPDNHGFLRDLDIEPVDYHEDVVASVKMIAPAGITAALDNHGRSAVLEALALGAPASRINSIADYAAPSDFGTAAVGGMAAPPVALLEIADLLAANDIVLPIAARYPLEQVSAAYERLMTGHTRGKIVLMLD